MMDIRLKDGSEFSAHKIEEGENADGEKALYAIVQTGESELAQAIVEIFKSEKIQKIEVER
jgi:hypothetical protein